MTLKKPTESSGWPNTRRGEQVWHVLLIELFIIGDTYAEIEIPKVLGFILTLKTSPKLCSRSQFQILLLFQK